VSKFQPDCIIIACNTVSTVALEKIRCALDIPVVGVVPAIKPAAAMSSTKVIGLLATPATVGRSYTAALVSDYANDCTLVSVGSTRLVEIAEQHLRGIKVDMAEISSLLEPFIKAEQEQQLDTIVLGCTHFPLLGKFLAQVLPKSIGLIDSSAAIARQVANILGVEKVEHQPKPNQQQCFMTKIGSSETEASFVSGIKGFGFQEPELFSI